MGGLRTIGGVFATVFFIGVVLTGTYILLNLFLAIAVKTLVDGIEAEELREIHRKEWEDNQVFDDGEEANPDDKIYHDIYLSHEWGTVRSLISFVLYFAARCPASLLSF